MSFFVWFAISPILPEIKESLNLTKTELWNSSIAGVFGTILVRLILGPLCDVYGPRVLTVAVLCLAAVPTFFLGFVQTAGGLALVRLCIGIAGGVFVMCQYWVTSMFTLEIVGTANGLAGGWGNVGAGFTNIIIGSLLFPIFKFFFYGDSEMAWRTVCIIPALASVISGICVFAYSDDTPKGRFGELKKHGCLTVSPVKTSIYSSVTNLNVWVLAIQYGCCFGVQLTMNNAAAMYFKEQFGQSTESAAAIASIFSWMLLFARALGGFFSDLASVRLGMQGRIIVHTIFLIAEGVFVVMFSFTQSLAGAICIMIVFSLFVDAATGSSFGIVPYVDAPCTGSIMGIVGAGGNIGAVVFGYLFRELSYDKAFMTMGLAAIGSGLLSVFINIKGHSSLFRGDSIILSEEDSVATESDSEKKDKVGYVDC